MRATAFIVIPVAASFVACNRKPVFECGPTEQLVPPVWTGDLAGGMPAVAPTPRLAPFTGEKAKQALLDLMATRDTGVVSRRDIGQFVGVAVDVADDTNSANWGPFYLDLAGYRYQFTRKSSLVLKFTITQYEGMFELREGTWVALPPQVTGHGTGTSGR